MMFGRGYYGTDGCFGLFGSSPWYMWVSMIFLAVLAIVIVLVLVKSKGTPKNTSSEALEQLKIKLVKGEITEEEYLRKKDILMLK